MILMIIFGYQMLMLHKQNNTKLINEHHEIVVKMLKNISSDKINCYDCLHNHTSHDQVKMILDSYKNIVDQHTTLKYLRSMLNIFGFFNIAIVLIVYGGTMIISLATMTTAVCLIVCQHLENVNALAYLESTIAFTGTLETVQCFYILIVTIVEVNLKNYKKAE